MNKSKVSLPGWVVLIVSISILGCEKSNPVEQPIIENLGNPMFDVEDWSGTRLEKQANVKRNDSNQIVAIDFRDKQFDSSLMSLLLDHPTIKSIRFGGASETTIDDNAFKFLGELPKLAVLAIDRQPVTTSGLSSLPAATRLVELYAADTKLDDSVGEVIQPMTSLKKLRLSQTAIGLQTCAAIAKLPALVELDISQCAGIDAACASELANCKTLEN